MPLERPSPCKINLLLNILGRRPDGFHELETVLQPVPIHDLLSFEKIPSGIQLTCSDPGLPADSTNLVFRAAEKFFSASAVPSGVRIRLEKRIPLAAGLGGGSGNAASALRALNELFGHPLDPARLSLLAAEIGSDVPFFLQDGPALAFGRGENIEPLQPFPALAGAHLLLIHPGFGVSTPWAYQNLARFPAALNGRPGRARALVQSLQSRTLQDAAPDFCNSLEAPVLEKYPLLACFQEFLREQGAAVALMSGSGSTTFALFASRASAESAAEKLKSEFGDYPWIACVPLGFSRPV